MVLDTTRARGMRSSRGFSLVEMMVVVAITAILAMIGITLFRKYIGSSKGTEAMAVIQAIRAAEESDALTPGSDESANSETLVTSLQTLLPHRRRPSRALPSDSASSGS